MNNRTSPDAIGAAGPCNPTGEVLANRIVRLRQFEERLGDVEASLNLTHGRIFGYDDTETSGLAGQDDPRCLLDEMGQMLDLIDYRIMRIHETADRLTRL